MGPRFCKRGNRLRARADDGHFDASMGPRFCKRGNGWDVSGASNTDELLQWGHAFVSVETGCCVASAKADRLRFNGATLL